MAKTVRVSNFKVDNNGRVVSHKVEKVYFDNVLVAIIVDDQPQWDK